MAVDTSFASLFENLKLEDPWLPPRPWESIPSESGLTTSSSSSLSTTLYHTSTLSEASLVRLVMNALQGVESALISIEKLSAVFCSEPADRTFHRIPSLWSRSLSTHALGKILKSIGRSGCVVFLLLKFVDYFTNLSLEGNSRGNEDVNLEAKENRNVRQRGGAEHPPHSLVNQAFAVAVGKVLEGYTSSLDTLYTSVGLRRSSKSGDGSSCSGAGCLMSIDHSQVTLLEVYLHSKGLRTQIEALGNICHVYDVALCISISSLEGLSIKEKFSDFPRGGDLLTYLYTQLKVSDPVHCALLKFLFLRSCEPYFDFIRSWIYKAKISDPYNEFIVDCVDILLPYSVGNTNIGISFDFPSASIRRDGVAVPCFLKELLIPLFRAGQQLQVLMKLLELSDNVGTWNRAYEDFLPYWSGLSNDYLPHSSPLTFSKGGIETIVLARNGYYKRMMEKLENLPTELDFRYPQLYTKRDRCSVGFAGLDWDPIGLESKGWLERPFEVNEIKAAVDACEGDKAPGPDGFTIETKRLVVKAREVGIIEGFEIGINLKEEDMVSLARTAGCELGSWPMSYLGMPLGDNPCRVEFWGPVAYGGPIGDNMHRLTAEAELFLRPQDLGSYSFDTMAQRIGSGVNSAAQFSTRFWFRLAGVVDSEVASMTDEFSFVEDPLDSSECSSINSSEEENHSEQQIELPHNRDQYPIGTSVNAESWKVKYNSDFLSMNPVVTKNSFVHLTNKLGETSATEYKKHLPFFDFTSVKDPFMASVDKLTAIPRHQFGTKRSVLTEPAVGKEGYNCEQVSVDNTKSSYVYSALGSMVNNRENVLLTNVSGGSGWESLLGNSNNIDDIKSRDHGNSLAIIHEIPLDFVIEKCLLEEIHLQYRYVSKMTIKLLEEGFNLREHLLALRRYHFMELADWADLFIMNLWHHKWCITEADRRISEIQSFLELSLQRSSCERDNNKDRLYVYMKKESIMPLAASVAGIHSFDFLGLGYRVDWPVSIVLTSAALKIYAEIFSFLIQVKLALSSLAEVWCSLKEIMHAINQNRHSQLHKSEVHHFNILMKLRQQVNHFVATLQQYVQSQLSHVCWSKFQRSLKHKVKDMMDLESVHMAYLTDSLHVCFLSDETRLIASIVQSILQCALDFRSCLIGSIWEAGLYTGGLQSKLSRINISQVLTIRGTFDKNIKELYLCYLKSPRHMEFGLSGFWDYLNYNEYYSEVIGKEMGYSAFPA
ncbi:hypothetical protein LguiB_031783 [Lonicera macranthoides]